MNISPENCYIMFTKYQRERSKEKFSKMNFKSYCNIVFDLCFQLKKLLSY